MTRYFFSLVLASMLFPITTLAYTTTQQSAFTLDDMQAFYTITFTLGHEDHEVLVPIAASHTSPASAQQLSYAVYDSDDIAQPGTMTGIVISDASVAGGMYRVPKGTKETFTLFVAHTPDAIKTDGQYRLAVTHLPFSFDGTEQLELNPSELQYYTTEYVTLTK